MGLLTQLEGKRLYLDTNIFVYALEGFPVFEPQIRELFSLLDQGWLRGVTSELALAEALVKPFLDSNVELQALYQTVIRTSRSLDVAAVSRTTLVAAARVRAATSLKLPDAIHAATAVEEGCHALITNDLRLRKFNEIRVLRLEDLA